jgi:anti-anti-sigma factor
VRTTGSHCVLLLVGEIDMQTAATVLTTGRSALRSMRPECTALIVDLAQVSFVDAAGVGILLALRAEARRADRQLRLRSVPPLVERVLRLTLLADAFDRDDIDTGRC